MEDVESARVHAQRFLERFRKRDQDNLAAARETRSRLETALAELGPRFGVRRALLFGSLAWGSFDASQSDVDLLVYGLGAAPAIDLTTELWERVGRPVQVVRAEVAASSLRQRVERDGEEIRFA